MAINNVTLVGRLVKDPEIKQTSNGSSVCSFTLAVDRNLSKERREDPNAQKADFPNCVAYRAIADFLGKYCHKGDKISLSGRIQTRTYDDQNGNRHYVTEVMVNELHNETSRNASNGNNTPQNNNQSNGYNTPQQATNNGGNNYNNPNGYNASYDPTYNNGFNGNDNNALNISNDDLPF